MLFAAIAAAAEGVKEASSLAGHPKDAERAAAAQAALPRAIAGDLSEAQYILSQKFHSATAYGKQQFANAWESLKAQNPGIAQTALQWGQVADAFNTDPSTRQSLLNEYNSMVANVRTDIANAVQRVASGAATGLAQAIDPRTGRATVPVSSATLWTVAAIALVILAILFASRKRA